MNGAELLLRCLEKQGVELIFGVPGDENAEVMIALLSSPIRFITCRHEMSAAFMAYMYGRLSGKPGVCMSTLGPGATTMLTGVANANLDYAPLVAIVGQANTQRMHKQSHQNIDLVTLYQPVTKWGCTIRDPESIPEIVRKAFKIAMTNKPGATVIEFPKDLAAKKLDKEIQPLVERADVLRVSANEHYIDKAMKLISQATAPIILVGAGCAREKCDKEVQEFIDKTGIYAANTFMAKGVVSSRHPRSLFCVGLANKDIAIQAYERADLIITLGYDMVEWTPEHWNAECCKTIIHVDTAPAEIDRFYLPAVELVGDICTSLRKMIEKITPEHRHFDPIFQSYKDQINKELTAHEQDDSFPLKPQRIISDVRQVLRDDDLLVCDVGAHKMWVARQYFTYHSNTCLISNGFCSMSSSLPGAFIAKILYPEKNVVALCGDGGFLMGIQALPTIVSEKAAITIVVWDDSGFGLIKWKQEEKFKQSSNVSYDNPDLATIARGFGCHARVLQSAAELQPALRTGLKRKDKPTVLIVPVDYSENLKLSERLGKIISGE